MKLIVTVARHQLKIDDENGSITLADPNNNKVTLDASGITLTHGESVSIAISSASVSVNNGALAGPAVSIIRQDFAFPFRIDPISQQTGQPHYAPHVDQMIRQLLLTNPGERVDLPQFGCGLRSLVFAPDSDALAATVKLQVIQGLSRWLAGVVDVVDVVVGAAAGEILEPGAVRVTVTYTLVETQIKQAVTVTVA